MCPKEFNNLTTWSTLLRLDTEEISGGKGHNIWISQRPLTQIKLNFFEDNTYICTKASQVIFLCNTGDEYHSLTIIIIIIIIIIIYDIYVNYNFYNIQQPNFSWTASYV